MLRQIRPDLWETPTASPFPGLTTHAYLWTPPSGDNVLFYAPGEHTDLDGIEELGGIAHHYLSHQDEAGPALAQLADRFGCRLHAPAAEADAIGAFARPDVLLDRHHVDANGVEVFPTPGHSPGSTCFQVAGGDGATYLFTGDTAFRDAHGRWRAGFIPGVSDRDQLAASLELLGRLDPDVVASSAFGGDAGAHELGRGDWAHAVREASATLPAPAPAA